MEEQTAAKQLFSSEQLAATNAMVSAAVQEAVKAVFAGLAPVFKDMAMTPEKIRAANAPYEDPAKIARELRESQKSKADEEQLRKDDAARKAACTHMDKNGRSALCVVHNYPDRQVRGICPLCQDLIHPKEYRIGPPDSEHPAGKPYMVEPHKDYRQVLQLESMS